MANFKIYVLACSGLVGLTDPPLNYTVKFENFNYNKMASDSVRKFKAPATDGRRGRRRGRRNKSGGG